MRTFEMSPLRIQVITMPLNERQGKGIRLTNAKIREIERLLKEGTTHAEIMRIVNVSRMSIYKIKYGLRRENPHKDISEYSSFFDGPIERCPGCGRKVHMPCLACQIEAKKKRELRTNLAKDRRKRIDNFK